MTMLKTRNILKIKITDTYCRWMMFISQIKKSEKQNAQAEVKQNVFDELQQEATRGRLPSRAVIVVVVYCHNK